MTIKVTEHIAEALERADLAQRRCEAATNPKIKEDWLDLELHWVRIAEDYRFVERMERFLDHAPAIEGSQNQVRSAKELSRTASGEDDDFALMSALGQKQFVRPCSITSSARSKKDSWIESWRPPRGRQTGVTTGESSPATPLGLMPTACRARSPRRG